MTALEGDTSRWKPREFPVSDRLMRIAAPKPPAKLKSKVAFPEPKVTKVTPVALAETIERLAIQQPANRAKNLESLEKKVWRYQPAKLVPRAEEDRVIMRLAVEQPQQHKIRIESKRKAIYDAKVKPRADGRSIDPVTGELVLNPQELHDIVERLAVIEPARTAARIRALEARTLTEAGLPHSLMSMPPPVYSRPASSAGPASVRRQFSPDSSVVTPFPPLGGDALAESI